MRFSLGFMLHADQLRPVRWLYEFEFAQRQQQQLKNSSVLCQRSAGHSTSSFVRNVGLYGKQQLATTTSGTIKNQKLMMMTNDEEEEANRRRAGTKHIFFRVESICCRCCFTPYAFFDVCRCVAELQVECLSIVTEALSHTHTHDLSCACITHDDGWAVCVFVVVVGLLDGFFFY